MRIHPTQRIEGSVAIPGDKSVSHRLAILGAMAEGKTKISNFARSLDCRSTLDCVSRLGVQVSWGDDEDTVHLVSHGWKELQAPQKDLDAGNSGTTIRLLSGPLAGRPFRSRIGGDRSLNGRPMQRIIDPLTKMGASIDAREGGLPPLTIQGAPLRGIAYRSPVASAQVKSCVLLAGLTAKGRTVVTEPEASRDHTERLLPHFGIAVERDGLTCSIRGGQSLSAVETTAPGDISSAFYFITAALLLRDSKITIDQVGTNPTRTGFLDLLEASGADIERQREEDLLGEPRARLKVQGSPQFLAEFPRKIGGALIPNLIDEIPILAVLATQCPRGVEIREAGELRKKESDRIRAVVTNLRAVGVEAEEFEDGFRVPYTPVIRGGAVETFGDHRIAMSFAVLGLLSVEGVHLQGAECADISFPGFYESLDSVRVDA